MDFLFTSLISSGEKLKIIMIRKKKKQKNNEIKEKKEAIK